MRRNGEGGEIFFNWKEKSVTRATVMRAFNQARQIQKTEDCVSGPKKLAISSNSVIIKSIYTTKVKALNRRFVAFGERSGHTGEGHFA